MPATDSERNKAARLRRLLREGRDVSDANRAWLAEYDAKHTGGRPRLPTTPPPAAPFSPPPPAPDSTAPAPAPAPASSAPPGWTTIDFGTPQSPASALAPDGVTCGDPNCPACRGNIGARRCTATGKLVWPPMSPESAQAIAQLVLWLVGVGISMWRKDKHYVAPNDDNIKEFGAAIATVQRNHFTWIGAGYEFFALGHAFTKYFGRALTEKPPESPPAGNSNAS